MCIFSVNRRLADKHSSSSQGYVERPRDRKENTLVSKYLSLT